MWAQKVKVVHFVWKLVHIVSQRCWFRIQTLKFRPQNPFLGKFGSKYSKFSVLSENWCTEYLKDADSKSRVRFLKLWPQNSFVRNLGPKIQIRSSCLKIGTHSISRMLIRHPDLHFWILTPKSICWQIWAQRFKFVSFVWKLVYIASQGCWFQIQT